MVDKIKELIENTITGTKIELVDLVFHRESVGLVLRVLVDKPGGITLDECAEINRDLSMELDASSVIDEKYVLEVSSPGLDRDLKTEKDFMRVRGETIKIVTRQPIAKSNVFIGKLYNAKEGKVLILTETSKLIEIAQEQIVRAKRYFSND
ncbi:MAG: ribosome maturation factor RimP [Candidatus Omnitrophota bacterium]